MFSGCGQFSTAASRAAEARREAIASIPKDVAINGNGNSETLTDQGRINLIITGRSNDIVVEGNSTVVAITLNGTNNRISLPTDASPILTQYGTDNEVFYR